MSQQTPTSSSSSPQNTTFTTPETSTTITSSDSLPTASPTTAQTAVSSLTTSQTTTTTITTTSAQPTIAEQIAALQAQTIEQQVKDFIDQHQIPVTLPTDVNAHNMVIQAFGKIIFGVYRRPLAEIVDADGSEILGFIESLKSMVVFDGRDNIIQSWEKNLKAAMKFGVQAEARRTVREGSLRRSEEWHRKESASQAALAEIDSLKADEIKREQAYAREFRSNYGSRVLLGCGGGIGTGIFGSPTGGTTFSSGVSSGVPSGVSSGVPSGVGFPSGLAGIRSSTGGTTFSSGVPSGVSSGVPSGVGFTSTLAGIRSSTGGTTFSSGVSSGVPSGVSSDVGFTGAMLNCSLALAGRILSLGLTPTVSIQPLGLTATFPLQHGNASAGLSGTSNDDGVIHAPPARLQRLRDDGGDDGSRRVRPRVEHNFFGDQPGGVHGDDDATDS